MDRRKLVGRLAAATFIGLVGLAGVTTSGVAGATSCPVTIPNGSPFPPGGGSFAPPPEGTPATNVPATHGDGLLWVGYLSWDGIIRVRDDYVEPNGSIELKFPWARKIVEYKTINGALTGIFAGELAIEAERLDGNAGPAGVYTNPSGVHITSLVTFPSTGCWQVTGRTGEEALTFTFLLLTESQTTPDTAAARPTPFVSAGVALLVVGMALGLKRVHIRRIG
ncbi:MAG TPA: hypothetical protein VEW95_10545 [Candidatus Limnocylindrales bacterium]|nr:hypothetical protein [Candidatus Limnocylindrales bacterium]